jgi:hypothetical protein
MRSVSSGCGGSEYRTGASATLGSMRMRASAVSMSVAILRVPSESNAIGVILMLRDFLGGYDGRMRQ